MAELLRFTAGVELTAAAAGANPPRRPRVAIVAYRGGPISPPGWPNTIIALDSLAISGSVPILAAHDEADLDSLAGQGVATVRNGELHVAGEITEATAGGRLVLGLARDGIALQASVGVQPGRGEYVSAGKSIAINGRSQTAGPAGLTIVRDATLREVSLVATGADANSSVTIAAQRGLSKGQSIMADEHVVTGDLREKLEANFHSAIPDPTLEERRLQIIDCWRPRLDYAGASAELKARADTLHAQAVNGEIGLDEYRRAAMRIKQDELPRGLHIQSSSRDTEPQVIEAAFARSVGLPGLEAQYTPQVLEASDRFRGIGVQELLLRAAAENGWAGARQRITSGNIREVLQYALPSPGIRAASTISVPGILSNVASKQLAAGFNSVEQTYAAISRPRPVSDFKQTSIYRLTAQCEYEELPPDGTMKHGTLGEESYTVQARTYAKMFGLTRQDIINDDLGAFDDIRTRLGRGAGLALNRVFWTKFLDDAAFFTGARGNLLTTAASALADDGTALDAANVAFSGQTDAEGGPLGVTPKILLVPPALGSIARRLYSSAEIRDMTSDARYGTANIWQNRFRPLESAYLSNATIAGSSDTAWYLLSDPAELPVVEIAYLDGKTAPTIESADADFDQLGIQFRGYHDFGVSLAEWRVGVKSAGA